MTIKNKLLQIRLQKGYKKQKDFAEFLSLDSNDYNRIENNKKQVNLETAFNIAQKLNMKIEDIFYKSQDEN
ncbi:helix-turn-helix domain protein [Clostridium ragsdalei P11]|uniref:Helix-turn-helix domain protein n=1 Tax=Clostridium ragsdalei P11 TaxID=1353534 RepID=A0A1A6AKW8_9CLOT|nr:helix-turn-helix domain-containing protein [Clostridium ragsdalei]OBR90691.1 helix-turn-helix domain protein [Clostridium ragsdalei P11]